MNAALPQLSSQRLIRSIDELPVLPSVLLQILELDPLSDDYFDDLVEIAQHDPMFAVKLLNMANSAHVRGRTEVSDVETAVTRLGGRAAGEILMSLSVMKVFVPNSSAERQLWVHSLQVAMCAREMARWLPCGRRPEQVYLAALLHDLGRFLMFQQSAEVIQSVDDATWPDSTALIAAERGVCGTDHAELGAVAAERWHLPFWIAEVIATHHEARYDTLDRRAARATAIVRQADFATTAAERGAGGHPDLEAIAEASIREGWPCVEPGRMTRILERALDESRKIASMMGL